MEEIIKLEWVDKYCPKTLDDYILNEDIKNYFRQMIKNKAIQNFSMVGVQGCGKTTLAKIIAKELDAETLFVKCATEGTIDVLRTKVQDFCNALSFENKPKIVILDEIDSASMNSDSNFQKGLRTLIESSQSDTRFILTGNYNKILPAILSRCPLIPLKFDKKDLLLRLKFILDSEKVKYSKESLISFIEEAFQYYPDCRRIINYLQFCSQTGELVVKLNKVANSEKSMAIEQILESIVKQNDVLSIRKFYMSKKEAISDYVDAGILLYNKAIDSGIVVDKDGILKMTDILYYINQAIDKESMFFGMVVAISRYCRK